MPWRSSGTIGGKDCVGACGSIAGRRAWRKEIARAAGRPSASLFQRPNAKAPAVSIDRSSSSATIGTRVPYGLGWLKAESMKTFTAGVVAVAICCFSPQAAAQTPLTPGAAALLIEPRGLADLNRLRDAIADSDPVVRAIAARVAGLLNRKELAGALLEALVREQDPTSAREQVRALLYLQEELLPEARAAATRLGGAIHSVQAEWLARTRPGAFAATLPVMLREVPDSEAGTFGSIAAMAVRQSPAERDRIAGALAGAGSAPAWREFLDRGSPAIDSDVPSLKAGLSSANAAVREATIWFVVSALASGRRISVGDLTSALGAPDATVAAEESEWAGFGRELLARRFGKSALDGSGAIQRYALKNSGDARAVASAPELTKDERAALRGVFPNLQTPIKSNTPTESKPPVPDTKSPALPLRTLRPLAPGLLSSLLAATKCTLPSDGQPFGAAWITYRPDGRPAAAALDTATLPPACEPFVKSLALLTVPQQDEPILEKVPHSLYLPMDKDSISCADESHSSPSREPARVGGKIQTPRKIKDVRPIYPPAMVADRVQGVVTLEANISPSGCVSEAKVTRSVAIPLDLAGLRAVLGWRFTPTLLDGAPVAVVMTVTVNFRLN